MRVDQGTRAAVVQQIFLEYRLRLARGEGRASHSAHALASDEHCHERLACTGRLKAKD